MGRHMFISIIISVLVIISEISSLNTDSVTPTIRTFNSKKQIYQDDDKIYDLPEYLSHFLPISEQIENEECRRHSLEVLNAFNNLELWALKMLDSTAKIPSGLLKGNIKILGEYDECVATMSSDFSGQYCLASVHVTPLAGAKKHVTTLLDVATLGRRDREITANRTNVVLVPDLLPSLSLAQLGVCVPSSCTPRDVELTLNFGLQRLGRPMGLTVSTEVPPGTCSVLNKNKPFTAGDFIVISTVLIFVFLVTASSAYNLLCPQKITNSCSPVRRALVAFSLPMNWKRLFSTDSSPPGALGSLEGIRVLSTIWVIMTHKILNYAQEPWVNKQQVVDSLADLPKMPLINTMLNVDTFLLVSGLLKSYHFLRDLENKKFNFFSCYSRRYLRLTPAYALMMAFYATLLVRLGSGPMWYKYMVQPADACRQNWPFNLLYLNNYINSNNQCMIQSWYLAADMQLCLLSPLVIYPLWRWPRLGKAVLGSAFVISIAVPLAIIYLTKTLPTYLVGASDEKIISYLQNMYYTTHTRMSPYVVGIALGYLIYRLNTTKLKLSKVTIAAGWALSLAVLYAVVFGAYDLLQYNYGYNHLEAMLYGAFHRPAWAIAVAWVIFACHNGYGGWVNDLLSARAFQPLSRLSYCIFLTHYVILMVGTGRIRTALYVDEYILFHDFAGDLVMILVASAVLYLIVEAPLFELTKILYGRGSVKAPEANIKAASPPSQSPTDLENVTLTKGEDRKNNNTVTKPVNGH